jgi:hypothetical protein
MASLTPTPKIQFFDANGNPLVGGKLYTYSAGALTPQTTYVDQAQTAANTNPVILDSRGEANVWLPAASYKFRLTDSNDSEIWTVDNVVTDEAAVSSALSQPGGSSLVGFIQAGTGAVTRTAQSKMREVVSVLDFGAVGDGVADDTAAIQAAFAASSGKRVVFPTGSYLVNAAVTTASSDIEIDFGTSRILNTVALPIVVIYGEDSNAIFNFTGNRVRVSGGYFLNGLSEGIRITGVFAGGDTYTGAGYTKDHFVNGCLFDNWDGNSVQIRFFKGATISNVRVKNKGSGDATSHHSEVAFKYGTDAKWLGNSVEFSDYGGAIYGLYVGNFVVEGNYGYTTNSLAPQSNLPFYFSFCENGIINGNIGYAIDGGLALKGSHGARLSVSNNRFENTGAGTDPYACIFMQGVDGFSIIGNHCKGYAQHVIRCSNHPSAPASNSRNGLIADNDIIALLNGTSRTVGDGIYCAQDTALTRGGIVITGNRLVDGSIYVDRFGGVDVPQSRVTGNTLTFTDDPNTSGACIWTTTCYGLNVSDNWVHVDDVTVEAKVGIRNTGGTYVSLANNYVSFVGNGVAGSVSYLQDGSPTANTVYWENNRQMRAETPFSGPTVSRTERVSADYGNADAILYVGDPITSIWNTALTGNRSAGLDTTGAYNGAKFRIVRTAAATGAFNLNVGTGPLKALAAGQWCDVEYNGSSWILSAFGSL